MTSKEGRERSRKEQLLEVDWSRLLTGEEPQLKIQQVASDTPAWVVDGLLSPSECAALIRACEKSNGLGRTPYAHDYRGNTRLMTTDPALAAKVWGRLRKVVPFLPLKGAKGCDPVGLNERWRWAKYWPGDVFRRHVDAVYERREGERSFLTVNIYLNGQTSQGSGLPTFKKGETRFFLGSRVPTHLVVPRPGRVLLFQQPLLAHLLHDGAGVDKGNKYLLRSDVVFRQRR